MGFSRQKLFEWYLVPFALISLAVFPYFPLFQNGFVNYDDKFYITANEAISRGLSREAVRWAFMTFETANWHPLTWISHALDISLFALNPVGHHLHNLLLHLLNGVLFFLFLRKTTGACWKSAVVTAIFLLHPLNVESVAWASERKNVLSSFFGILALYFYGGYVRKPSWLRYLYIFFALALGLLSKPALVTLPFVFLLLDFWPFGRLDSLKKLASLVTEKIPFFVLIAASAWVTFIAQRAEGAMSTFERMPFLIRVENAVLSYGLYLIKWFWPVGLSPFYPHPGPLLRLQDVILSAAVLLGLTLIIWRQRIKRPYLLFGWLWYMGILVPMIGLIQVGAQSMADRYMYLPMIGLTVAAVWLAGEYWGRTKRQRITAGIAAAAILAGLGTTTFAQTMRWKDDKSLFEHALRVTKRNHIAYNGLGLYWAENGNCVKAIEPFMRAVEITPDFADGHNNLGICLKETGQYDLARKHLEFAIKQKPDNPQAHNNLGNVYLEMREFDKAISHYERAIKLRPRYAKAANNLGFALILKGEMEKALPYFEMAVEWDPRFQSARNNLSLAVEKLNAAKEKASPSAPANY